MTSVDGEHLPPSAFEGWNTIIVRWLSQLSVPEQKALLAQWLLRKRQDAQKKLEELFKAEFIDTFREKIRRLGFQLGGEFVDSEKKLLSQLYCYMVSVIPESIRSETQQLVQAALAGRPIVRMGDS